MPRGSYRKRAHKAVPPTHGAVQETSRKRGAVATVAKAKKHRKRTRAVPGPTVPPNMMGEAMNPKGMGA